jgi:plasmid stability protein
MVSLSIKSVPNDLARALHARAARNHRSMQGELMHILETALQPKVFDAVALRRKLDAIGLKTPAESAAMIREDRDR